MRVVANALRKRHGNINHLRHFLHDPALIDQVFDLIVRNDSKIKRRLDVGEYRVQVDYTSSRKTRDEYKTYEEYLASNNRYRFFKRNKLEHHLYSSCRGIDETPGERIMLVKRYDNHPTSEEIVSEMRSLGYRPPTSLEAYAFAKENPDLECTVHALSSFVESNDDSFCLVLGKGHDPGHHSVHVTPVDRYLSLDLEQHGEWFSASLFLFVRV